MKRYRVLLAAFLCLAFSSVLRAQFYAPETEFHDRAQRLFPVELVRVVAWSRAPLEVREITYSVATATNRVTTWRMAWRDGSGKILKEFNVSYPETLLGDGPEFYRNIFNQVAGQAGLRISRSLTRAELSERFWAGAELNGPSREEGLRAAWKLASRKAAAPEVDFAPAMSGVLLHCALPSLCGGLTLDSMLMARGAVWLAWSESMLKENERSSGECWAPLLFLSGREPAACGLWASAVAGAGSTNAPTLKSWWDCMLRRPSAREAFVFATSRAQRRFGMPMLTYYSRIAYLGEPLSEILYRMDSAKKVNLADLHNYGWFLAGSTDIVGGRLLEGALAAVSREEWRKLLLDYSPSATDFTNYVRELKNTPATRPLQEPDADDASLTGLEEFAPLLQLGFEHGQGSLAPVCVVSARDLLNYGWEMDGMQMGARYFFVKRRWGIPALAKKIFNRATRSIEGQALFFPGDQQTSAPQLEISASRLQWVDDIVWRVNVPVQPFSSKEHTDPAAAHAFKRRCWLRPYYCRWQAWSFREARLDREVVPLLNQYHTESGSKADAFILEYLGDCFEPRDFEVWQGLRELQTNAAKSMPDTTTVQVRALYGSPQHKMFSEQRGQKYEELFWRNPDCGLESQILVFYINGGAWKSARRFYTQTRKMFGEDLGFSNFMAPQAWALGFISNDPELMEMAVEDSNSGSAYAMWTHVWHSAAHERFDSMRRQLDEMINRYESQEGSNSPAALVRGFIPLIQALKNPKSPDRAKALDYFGPSNTGIVLRWVLIKKYKLPVEDAIRLLGGKNADRMRLVLVLSLLKDKEHMFNAIVDYQEHSENQGAARVFAQWAARETLPVPLKIEERDLRPKNAQSIRHAVMEALAAEPKS